MRARSRCAGSPARAETEFLGCQGQLDAAVEAQHAIAVLEHDAPIGRAARDANGVERLAGEADETHRREQFRCRERRNLDARGACLRERLEETLDGGGLDRGCGLDRGRGLVRGCSLVCGQETRRSKRRRF